MSYGCIVWSNPSPYVMVLFWSSLGAIGILLGFFALILGPRPRVGFALGLTLSLGSIALMSWEVTSQILKMFKVTPAGFLLFPEISIAAMTGATVLYGCDFLRRGREIITAITS